MNFVVALSLLPTLAAPAKPEPVPSPPREVVAAKAPALKRSPVAAEVFPVALADARALPPGQALKTRYLWVETGTPEEVAALRFNLGLLSLASKPVDPVVVGNGTLLRLDLARYGPRAADLQLWLDSWEQLQFDPAVAKLVTRDHLDFLKKLSIDRQPKVQVKAKPPLRPRFRGKETGFWTLVKGWEWRPLNDGPELLEPPLPVEPPTLFESVPIAEVDDAALKGVNVLRFNAPHIDPSVFLELQNLTGSLAPVVSSSYFVSRTVTTIKDDGLYRDVYGGLYYEFARVRTAKEAGEAKLSDLDVLFKDLGLGDNAKRLFEDLRSDQRLAMFKSKVTGKWRVVVVLPTPATGEGRISVVVVTIDPRDQDIDHRQQPFLNLLDPQGAGIEVIWVKPNGLPGFSANAAKDGARVDFVPPDIATDRTVPAPHTTLIQGSIGCISCHCASGSSLWIEASNDVKKLLSRRLDVNGDLADRRADTADTLDRLAGLYFADADLLFQRARDDFNRAALKHTRPRAVKVDDLLEVGKTASAELLRIHNRHRYDEVDARRALKEIGFVAETNEQAIKALEELLPPDPEAIAIGFDGSVQEDPRVEALLTGLAIQRVDWDLVKADVIHRSQRALAGVPKKGK